MSSIWSLTGAKRTWQEKLVSVAIDPKPTWGKGVGLRLPLTRSDYREDR
jgi:hypothetical protein